jgi:hypothetical protein
MATIDVQGQFVAITAVAGPNGTIGAAPFDRTGIHTVVLVTVPASPSGDYGVLLPDSSNSFIGDVVEVITVSDPGSNGNVVSASPSDSIGLNGVLGNFVSGNNGVTLRRTSATKWFIVAQG